MQFEDFPKTKIAYLKVKCASEAAEAFEHLHKCLHEHITDKTLYFGWKECEKCKDSANCEAKYRFGISVPLHLDEGFCKNANFTTIEAGRIAYQHRKGKYEDINLDCSQVKEMFTKKEIKCRSFPFYLCLNDPHKVSQEDLEQKLCWQIE